jgi:enoyl-[acyl-carrier protein] reductase/trans-2-enoyl-CoA reductase (NAD+)
MWMDALKAENLLLAPDVAYSYIGPHWLKLFIEGTIGLSGWSEATAFTITDSLADINGKLT